MINAEEARALIPEYNRRIENALIEIEYRIIEAAERGLRKVEFSAGIGYNTDVANELRNLGYTVSHITAPFDELRIQW